MEVFRRGASITGDNKNSIWSNCVLTPAVMLCMSSPLTHSTDESEGWD